MPGKMLDSYAGFRTGVPYLHGISNTPHGNFSLRGYSPGELNFV